MTLAPEIQSLLDWGSKVDDSCTELTLPERRKVIRNALDRELRRQGVVVEQVATTVDEKIAVNGGEIGIRVFVPDRAGPHPAFVHFHGGGFVFGTIDSLVNDAKCAHLCRAVECVVVTVDYRLAPEYRFPTAAEDCYAALLWTVANADALAIDPARVAVGGESAGGNLAAVVSLIARDRDKPSLALQLLETPVIDMSDRAADYPSVALFGEGYGLDRVAMDYYADEYLADPVDRLNPYASPLLAEDLTRVAPAHVMTAEYDVLRDASEAYARRLAESGVETTLHRMLGHNHGSSVLWQTWAPARSWMDEVVRALRSALLEREVSVS